MAEEPPQRIAMRTVCLGKARSAPPTRRAGPSKMPFSARAASVAYVQTYFVGGMSATDEQSTPAFMHDKFEATPPPTEVTDALIGAKIGKWVVDRLVGSWDVGKVKSLKLVPIVKSQSPCFASQYFSEESVAVSQTELEHTPWKQVV